MCIRDRFWNYAKLISGVLRHGMPITNVVSLIESLHLNSETINTWKLGVELSLIHIYVQPLVAEFVPAARADDQRIVLQLASQTGFRQDVYKRQTPNRTSTLSFVFYFFILTIISFHVPLSDGHSIESKECLFAARNRVRHAPFP